MGQQREGQEEDRPGQARHCRIGVFGDRLLKSNYISSHDQPFSGALPAWTSLIRRAWRIRSTRLCRSQLKFHAASNEAMHRRVINIDGGYLRGKEAHARYTLLEARAGSQNSVHLR